MKGGFQISYSAFLSIGLVLLLFFLAHRACINTDVETFEPNGQVYRPSGASEGYPAGVEFMQENVPDTLYGIHIDDVDGGDSHEIAIHIGEGWDCPIEIVDKDGDVGCMTVTDDGYVMWEKYPKENVGDVWR
jgi:hypothetical protein